MCLGPKLTSGPSGSEQRAPRQQCYPPKTTCRCLPGARCCRPSALSSKSICQAGHPRLTGANLIRPPGDSPLSLSDHHHHHQRPAPLRFCLAATSASHLPSPSQHLQPLSAEEKRHARSWRSWGLLLLLFLCFVFVFLLFFFTRPLSPVHSFFSPLRLIASPPAATIHPATLTFFIYTSHRAKATAGENPVYT
jgi:hypothetical protein